MVTLIFSFHNIKTIDTQFTCHILFVAQSKLIYIVLSSLSKIWPNKIYHISIMRYLSCVFDTIRVWISNYIYDFISILIYILCKTFIPRQAKKKGHNINMVQNNYPKTLRFSLTLRHLEHTHQRSTIDCVTKFIPTGIGFLIPLIIEVDYPNPCIHLYMH